MNGFGETDKFENNFADEFGVKMVVVGVGGSYSLKRTVYFCLSGRPSTYQTGGLKRPLYFVLYNINAIL